MNFLRQTQIFNPEEYNCNVVILGAGSTGSYVAFTLAKMGIKNIKVIDYDKIEDHNLPNQYYRISDIGKFKVDALQEIIKDFCGINIEIENVKIEKDMIIEMIGLNTIIINCVDNIETRKIIAEDLQDYSIKIIDTRFGGEGYSIHIVSLDDDKSYEKYIKGLENPILATSCGEKAVIYTINSLASEVCNIVKKMLKGEKYPILLRRELKTYRFIGGGR